MFDANYSLGRSYLVLDLSLFSECEIFEGAECDNGIVIGIVSHVDIQRFMFICLTL